MNCHDFTLTFQLSDQDQDPEQYVDALAEHGCTDAVVGIGKLGSITLNFTREAGSALEAVASAIRDCRTAMPGATLTEAAPDFVGITEIAAIYGVSRQYMRKCIRQHAMTFPQPVHEGKPSLWHLAEVIAWLQEHQPGRVQPGLNEISRLAMQINAWRSLSRAGMGSGGPLAGGEHTTTNENRWLQCIREATASYG